MQCFYVLVHGRLNWRDGVASREFGDEPLHPTGFYCHRYVLAANSEAAKARAFRRARDNLDKQTGWIASGQATLSLEADDIAEAPMRKAFAPDNRGHTFYLAD